MSLNSHIGEIVGKRIAHVITSENPGNPNQQVFFVFDDNTTMEFFGSFGNEKGLWPHDFEGALKYAKGSNGKVRTYPENNEGEDY